MFGAYCRSQKTWISVYGQHVFCLILNYGELETNSGRPVHSRMIFIRQPFIENNNVGKCFASY